MLSRRAIQWIRSGTAHLVDSFQTRAIVLMYHRVVEVSSDPQSICVSPEKFGDHLRCVRRHYLPFTLQDMRKAILSGEVPRGAVAVTLDDGYADNAENAAPLLERYDIPATIFVTAGCIDEAREFWWDELERLLLSPGKLPSTLRLTIGGARHVWKLRDSLGLANVEGGLSKVPTSRGSAESRYDLYTALHRLLRPLNDMERRPVLDALSSWAQRPIMFRPEYRPLTSDELRRLARDSVVEIGSHTITHPLLAAVPLEIQTSEITKSRRKLQEITGTPVVSFAYPYGKKNDVGNQSVQLVKEAGYEVACASVGRPITRFSDPFWLPRYHVHDWNGEEFSKRLRSMIGS